MTRFVPVPDAAAILGIHPDTVRRRLRAGTLRGQRDPGPPARWLVEVDDDATTPPDDATARRVVEVEADNAALRRELQTVHEALRHERAQAELLAKAHEQLTRALPAPAAVALALAAVARHYRLARQPVVPCCVSMSRVGKFRLLAFSVTQRRSPSGPERDAG